MTLNRFFLIFTTLFFSVFACVPGPYDGPMGRSGHMMNYGYGGMFMWLIFLVIAGVIIYFVLVQTKKSSFSGSFPKETPLDILKQRYVKGEITKEEFDRMKKDIESE